MDVIYRPEKRKSKRKPKIPQRNPPDRKTGFMHERTEKSKKKQREEQKNEVVYLVTRPGHPRDRLRRKVKDRLRKEAEDEVVYLSTRPRRPRDRFRDRVKDKKWHK